jgi:hypothetical protein
VSGKSLDRQLADGIMDGRLTDHDADEVRNFASYLEATVGIPTNAKDRSPEQQAIFLKAYKAHYPEDYAKVVEGLSWARKHATENPGHRTHESITTPDWCETCDEHNPAFDLPAKPPEATE